ncbi:MAG: hypothetical protein JWL59_2993 [Chthoniobacteraceae bacterium]|nr:hypothetical protein [Chthoniobacteraceae bacterium]
MKLHIAAWLLASAGIAPGLDLTPETSFKELEGTKILTTFFKDGARTVIWDQPWPVSGGGTKIALYPPDVSGSAMFIEIRKPQADAIPQPGATQTELEKWAVQFLPQDITKLVCVRSVPCPYQLHTKPSQEFIFDYVSQVRCMSSSISYVDLNENERVIVHITAPTEAFKPIRATALKSMFRWKWSN